MTPDIIDDVADILIAAGVDTALIERAVMTARAQWGGAASYVKRIDRQRRDTAIRDALAAGATKSQAAAAVGCGINTVKRIKC